MAERRQAEPRRVLQRRDRFRIEAAGDGGDKPTHHDAGENRNASEEPFRCRRDHQNDEHRQERVAPVGRSVLGRHRREVQTDQGDDRAGHDRRHEAVDPLVTDLIDDQADHEQQESCCDDASQGEAHVLVGAHAGDHRTDERKARPEITRDLVPGDHEERQRANAAEEDRRCRRKSGDERHQERGAEHGDHVLHADADRLRPRQPFVRRDYPASRD